MNCNQNLFKIIARISTGFIVTVFLLFGIYSIGNYQSSKNEISYDEALWRLQSNEIKEVHINNDGAKFIARSGNELLVSRLSEIQIEDVIKGAGNHGILVSLEPNSANSFDRVFQIIFILFVISPPLIVLMLFLIWKELKKRNRMQ